MKTLTEICESLGVTRIVIQGYEDHRLISSCGKGKGNRLLYDDDNVERIMKIRFFQNIGFSLKEIRSLIILKDEELVDILERKMEETDLNILKLKRRIKTIGSINDLLKQGKQLDKKLIYKIAKEKK